MSLSRALQAGRWRGLLAVMVLPVLLILALVSCESPAPAEVRVYGKVVSARGLPPGQVVTLVTMPGPAGGVVLSTDIGGGRRALTLTRENTLKVMSAMQAELQNWSRLRSSAPFSRTLFMTGATTRRVNPFILQVAKPAGAPEPVFMLGVAYYETQAYVALDRQNAINWLKALRSTLG